MMFLKEQFNLIVRLTNIRLCRKQKRETTHGEILTFFGALILITGFEFGS